MNFLFSIQFRLFVLCAGLLAILAGTNLYLGGIIRQTQALEFSEQDLRLRVSLYADAKDALNNYPAASWQYTSAAQAHTQDLQSQAREQLESARYELEVKLAELGLYDPGTVTTVHETLQGLPQRTDQVISALRAGDGVDAQAMFADLRARLNAVEQVFVAAYVRERRLEESVRNQSHHAAMGGADLAAAAVLPVSIVALLLGLGTARSIVKPLRIMVTAIRKVSAGDTQVELPPVTRNEFGDMAQALRQLRDHSERLHSLAYVDPLTGLHNRARMEEALNAAIQDCRRTNQGCALLFMDIDNFKVINESFGHDTGDRYLVEAAQRLKRLARQYGLLCRYSGDKFTVLIAGLHKNRDIKQQVQVIGEDILKGMSELFEMDGRQLQMSVSMGAASYPSDGARAEQILSNADAAMYLAKRRGRNNLQFASRELSDSARRRVTLASEIRRGLEAGEFAPHYQPVIDVNTGRVVGIEALLRWNHPSRGIIWPTEFIPVAEESGLISAVGERSLRMACTQVKRWRDEGRDMSVTVNLSARQLHEGNLLNLLDEAIKTSGADPRWVALELTESAMMERPEQSHVILTELRARGHLLAIDDFGTGYSSLSHLQRFPIDTIKIDRSFVVRLDGSQKAEAIITATIAMAKTLGMSLIAEGVETQAQSQRMRELGCAYQQGFLFSEGLPPKELEIWVDQYQQNHTSSLPLPI